MKTKKLIKMHLLTFLKLLYYEYMVKLVEKAEASLILIATFLVPVITLPSFLDTNTLPKLLTLGIFIILLLLAFSLGKLISGKGTIKTSPTDFLVLLLALVYLVSGIIKTPNKIEAFFAPGIASIILLSSLYYFFSNQIMDKQKLKIVLAIFVSGAFLALITSLRFLGIFSKIDFLATDPDYLTTLVFLVPMLMLGVTLLISQKEIADKLLISIPFILILLGVGISLINVLPSKNAATLIPPLDASKAIAFDTLKQSFFLGAGPGNYLSAYNLFRPITTNTNELWSIRFTSASNFYLTVLTETGILGFLAICGVLFFALYKIKKSPPKNVLDFGLVISLIALIVLLAVFPAGISVIFLLFALISLNTKTTTKDIQIRKNTYFTISLLLILLAIVFIVIKVIPVLTAEAKFKSTYVAVARNDGKSAYDLVQSAINLDPYVDRYHASLSQISFALAASISQNKNLTDQEKSAVSSLINQAVKEGQITVSLNPTRSSNWEILAKIYQNIIPYTDKASDYAIESYGQAITYDPLNPNLRIALGGIYYGAKKYDDAINIFNTGVAVKPDLANSYYNLALSFEGKGDTKDAIDAINTVLTLVDKNSNDYKVASAELLALQKKATTENSTPTPENLTTPPANQAPVINPPLELPTDATPSSVVR